MKMNQVNQTYATFGLMRSLQQVRHTLHSNKQADENMSILFRHLRRHETRIAKALDKPLPLEGLNFLEIGPGQGLERAYYFGMRNDVTALDLDVIASGPMGYLKMIKENGFGRFAKTVGRKLLVGGANSAAWAKVIGAKDLQAPTLMHGDICQMAPKPSTYDAVISWSVFEHLPNPEAALEHVIQALQPGGVFYISLHLYTSNSGHHDIRAFTGKEDALPLWGHLRSSTRHLIEASSYLNEWRLSQWRELLKAKAPGFTEYLESYEHKEKYGSQMTPELRSTLSDYTDEELYTVNAIYMWKK
jgi:SAM-dependent methyltransferase